MSRFDHNRVAFVYCSTDEHHLLERLSRSISTQRLLQGRVPGFDEKAKYLVYHGDVNKLPPQVADFFSDNIYLHDPFVYDGDRRYFCLSKFRNKSIDIAKATRSDYLFLCDVDTVVFAYQPPGEDISFGVPRVYWQKSEGERLSESLKVINEEGDEAYSKGCSWFILRRDVFEQVDFSELIYGYGFEDNEFDYRAYHAGYSVRATGSRVIHMYHAVSERKIDGLLYSRNRALYEATKFALKRGFAFDWRSSFCLQTIHPEWSGHVVFLQGVAEVALLPDRDTYATYKTDGRYFHLWWENGCFDRFLRNGKTLDFLSRSESST